MRITRSLEFQAASKEEKLPYNSLDFPYIASRAELDFYRESFVPWHWHSAIELFFIESGELTYATPNHTLVFPAGSAGMVNAGVLHMTQFYPHQEKNVQLLHIFDPRLLAGSHGSLIEKKYISPVISSPQIELIALHPGKPEQAGIISQIWKAFSLSEDDLGYEIKIREALSHIWVELFRMCIPLLTENPQIADKTADKVKGMMAYIHEHYPERITIPILARSVFISERECYRVFHKHLHMTPLDYIKSYRIQAACQMLVESQMPVTEIGNNCGLGNTSYFGKLFREATGYTPLQYRKKWQNRDEK